MEKDKIIGILKSIVTKLVQKRYDDLLNEDYKHLLNSEEISQALQDYGGELTMPPDSAYENLNIYTVKKDAEVNVDFDLWINNELSDLTLGFSVIKQNTNYKYSIQNIHVL